MITRLGDASTDALDAQLNAWADANPISTTPDFSTLSPSDLASIQSAVNNAYPDSITNVNQAVAQATGGRGWGALTPQSANALLNSITPTSGSSAIGNFLSSIFGPKPVVANPVVGSIVNPLTGNTTQITSNTVTYVAMGVGAIVLISLLVGGKGKR